MKISSSSIFRVSGEEVEDDVGDSRNLMKVVCSNVFSELVRAFF